MRKLLVIIVLSLLFSGNAYAETLFKLTGCDFGSSTLEINLKNKTVKFSGNRGVYSGSHKISKIEGLVIETQKKTTSDYGRYAFRINLVHGDVKFLRPLTSYESMKYCNKVNGKLTGHGIARNKQKINPKPKTVAKKPENKSKIPNAGTKISDSVWVVKGSGIFLPDNPYRIKFNSDGTCIYYPSKDLLCTWSQQGKKLFYEINYYSRINATINKDRYSGSARNNEKDKWKITAHLEDIPKAVAKKPDPVIKKIPSKKQVTKAPEVDGSLLTIGSGSGFYINNKGYALTNNHVVDICKQMVAVVDGREILFRVLNTDKTNDVAVIKTDHRSPNFIKINEEGAKLGEDIIAVGYPLSGRLSDSVKITRGIVSALSGMNNNSGQIQIDAALQPGNSGGPVINENGELIGIASAGLNKLLMAKEAKYIPENVNFAVSSSIVTNILKNKKVSYSTPSFFSGSYSNTELATLGDKVTLQLFCRNTRTAYNKLKRSKQYSHILIDLD
ncbi:serine protease [Pelagibacteraceae bacterium]|nr:serine protease [Pelagibacteraceae bacterium]